MMQNESLVSYIKIDFVHSKELTAESHFPSSTKFIGGLNRKFAFAYSF